MGYPYFKPWQGSHYADTRTVILSESTYNWPGDDGAWLSPKPAHPTRTVQRAISGNGQARYFTQLTRAICQCREPDRKQREDAWNSFACTVFVQESVGRGPGVRPTRAHWRTASELFPRQLSSIQPKPQKLIVTGVSAWHQIWNRTPERAIAWLTDDLLACDFGGSLLWCLAVPHPANQQKGFNPMDIGMRIQQFVRTSFPASV